MERVLAGTPEGWDWDAYVEAALYGRTFQPELLAYLLPDLLAEAERRYGKYNLPDMIPLVVNRLLAKTLDAKGVTAVAEFLVDATLEQAETLVRLRVDSRAEGAALYRWAETWALAARVPGTMARYLPAWLEVDSSGKAIGLFHFAGTLLYPDDENPLVAPWTPQAGGGPPAFTEQPGHAYGQGWTPENLTVLTSTLYPRRLLDLMLVAIERVPPSERDLARSVVDGLPRTARRLERRWPLLLGLFADPESSLTELWDG